MRVELRDVDSIRPYESNPRENDQAVDAVAASPREFGFRQPLVIDEAGVIIVGHTRWKAAKKLGPANQSSQLTPCQSLWDIVQIVGQDRSAPHLPALPR